MLEQTQVGVLATATRARAKHQRVRLAPGGTGRPCDSAWQPSDAPHHLLAADGHGNSAQCYHTHKASPELREQHSSLRTEQIGKGGAAVASAAADPHASPSWRAGHGAVWSRARKADDRHAHQGPCAAHSDGRARSPATFVGRRGTPRQGPCWAHATCSRRVASWSKSTQKVGIDVNERAELAGELGAGA